MSDPWDEDLDVEGVEQDGDSDLPEGSNPLSESPEARAARTRRNWLLAGALLAFVALVFIVTIIRLGGHAFE